MTIDSNCSNRVAKILKVVLDGNDLAQLDASPIDICPVVVDGKFKSIIAFSLFNHKDNDYKGSLLLCYNGSNFAVINSWILDSGEPSLYPNYSHDYNGMLQIRKGDDFTIGLTRGPIELFIYYFEEKVSIPYTYEYDSEE